MFETKTTWEDSGHDCAHCGGEIYKRTDTVPKRGKRVYFECRRCGCQWKQNGDLVRVGNGRYCRSAATESGEPVDNPWTRRAFIIVGVLLLLAIARVGGIGALRYLVPLLLLGFIGWTVLRLGREQEWW